MVGAHLCVRECVGSPHAGLLASLTMCGVCVCVCVCVSFRGAEVADYAKWLDLDVDVHEDLMWIAREGLRAPLPAEWKAW